MSSSLDAGNSAKQADEIRESKCPKSEEKARMGETWHISIDLVCLQTLRNQHLRQMTAQPVPKPHHFTPPWFKVVRFFIYMIKLTSLDILTFLYYIWRTIFGN